MNSGLDIQLVRNTYQRMTDEELVRVLTQDVANLTPEALEVVKEEIERRKLDPNITRGVDAQQKSYTLAEIDAYCELIRVLPCPKTGDTSQKLNATLTAEAMSFIIFTQYKKKIVVGSPDTLDNASTDAMLKSVLLGWWGIPWGIIRTIQAIIVNIKSKKTNRLTTPNKYLRSFVLAKIGEIETYKNDREKLAQVISGK